MSQVPIPETMKDGILQTQAKKRGRPARTIGKADQPDESLPPQGVDLKVKLPEVEIIPRAAQTVTEFRDHLAIAKFNHLKTLEISEALFKHLFKCDVIPNPPYVMYEGLKVVLDGQTAEAERLDSMDMEQKTFNNPNLVTVKGR